MEVFISIRSLLTFYVQKNVAGQGCLAKLLQPLVSFNLVRIQVYLKKALESCQRRQYALRIEDKKLHSSSCSVNSHYEQSSCFQQKFVVWALAAY